MSIGVARAEDYAWGERHTTSQLKTGKTKTNKHDMKLNALTGNGNRSFLSSADKGDKPVRNCFNFFRIHFFASAYGHFDFDQDSMSCLAFALVSPPSASATIDLRGVPRIGHFGTTHLYGFKKFRGPRSPRLG